MDGVLSTCMAYFSQSTSRTCSWKQSSKPQCLQKGILCEATCSTVRLAVRGAAGRCSMGRISMTQEMTG